MLLEQTNPLMKKSLISLIALAALPLVSFASAPAAPTPPPIGGTAIPGGSQTTSFVITKSGAYYLAADRVMAADVNAITVSVPDVTIDLNGCTLSFTGGSTANGIEIPAVSNVEIRNGSINDVPADAIKATGGSGLRVIDVRVTTAGKSGINSTASLTTVDRSNFTYCGSFGVYVFTGVSARVSNSNASYNGQMGICFISVSDSEVLSCHATNNQRSGIAMSGSGCLASNNVVSANNLSKSPTEAGLYLGAWSTARNNVLNLNFINGIFVAGSNAILDGNNITLTGDANNNAALGTAIKASGTVLYLNNHISPSTDLLVGALVNGGGNILF